MDANRAKAFCAKIIIAATFLWSQVKQFECPIMGKYMLTVTRMTVYMVIVQGKII